MLRLVELRAAASTVDWAPGNAFVFGLLPGAVKVYFDRTSPSIACSGESKEHVVFAHAIHAELDGTGCGCSPFVRGSASVSRRRLDYLVNSKYSRLIGSFIIPISDLVLICTAQRSLRKSLSSFLPQMIPKCRLVSRYKADIRLLYIKAC